MADPIITWNAGGILDSVGDKVERGMNLAVAFLVAEASNLVTVPGLGEPSAPGQPPLLQSGTLHANMDFEVERRSDAIHGFFGVRNDVAYALRLELGFVGVDSLGRHYDQAPRPFLRPALLRNRDRIIQILASEAQ